MANSLKSLSRVQKFNIDILRKKLNELVSEEDKLVRSLAALEMELAQEKKFSNGNTEAMRSFGSYMKRYLKTKEAWEAELAELRKQIEETKDAIIELYKEQKTYDIVDANREKRKLKEADAREQSTLDEIGTNAYIKRKK